ncbi:MAG: hypothetical protein EOP50_03470 [Sphingobacteriales bacterium]|nr:MAG: hypothetical protein EOP50_03470 [Sphingobacteriales bacterium]
MKTLRCCLLAALLFCVQAVHAQVADSASGYVITLQNDTVRCRIFLLHTFNLNGDDDSFQQEVLTRDPDGAAYAYNPKQLLGFGFIRKNKVFHYRSLRPDATSRPFFAKVLVLGRKLTLFYDDRVVVHLDGESSAALLLSGGQSGARTQVQFAYVLRDEEGRALRLRANRFEKMKKQLLQYFAKDKEVVSLVESMVTGFEALPDFVRAVNALQAGPAAPQAP